MLDKIKTRRFVLEIIQQVTVDVDEGILIDDAVDSMSCSFVAGGEWGPGIIIGDTKMIDYQIVKIDYER